MRALHLRGRAGRTGAHAHTLALQQDDQAAGLKTGKAHVEKPGQPQLGRARPRDDHPRQRLGKARLQAVAQTGQAAGLLAAHALGQLQRGGHAHDAGHVLGPRAHAALLPAAVHQRPQGHAVCRPQGAHLLGPIGLGGRQGEKVAAQVAHVHRDLPKALRGVHMKPDGGVLPRREAPLALAHHGATDLANGLQTPYLAVCQLDRDKRGRRGQRPRHLARVHASVGPHAHQGMRAPLEAGQHAVVLARVGHHVACGRGKGKVVGLGGARREGHVSRARADDGRHACAGVLDGGASPSRQRIGGRGVVKLIGKVGQHLG